jgi:hypothetical protein
MGLLETLYHGVSEGPTHDPRAVFLLASPGSIFFERFRVDVSGAWFVEQRI